VGGAQAAETVPISKLAKIKLTAHLIAKTSLCAWRARHRLFASIVHEIAIGVIVVNHVLSLRGTTIFPAWIRILANAEEYRSGGSSP
jgi:hypothetical protein